MGKIYIRQQVNICLQCWYVKNRQYAQNWGFDHHKGRTVIAKTPALVGCSQSAPVIICQKWSKEEMVRNHWQGHGQPRVIDPCGEGRMPVWFDPAYELLCLKLKRKLMLVLTDRCQKTQCIRFLFMGLHSRRPVSARADPCPTQKAPHWAR